MFINSLKPTYEEWKHDFEQCPAKYRFNYIMRIPLSFSPHLFLGSAIHKAIYDFGIQFSDSGSEEDLLNFFREVWKQERERLRVVGEFDMNKEQEKEYGTKGIEMLRNFYKSQMIKPPFLGELMIECPVSDDVRVTGKVDRLDMIDEQSFSITDYKTGKLDRKYLDPFQINLYAYIMNQTNRRTVKGILYYLPDDEIIEYDMDDETLKRTEFLLKAKVLGIKRAHQENSFPEKPSVLCKWCDFVTQCPKGAVYTGQKMENYQTRIV